MPAGLRKAEVQYFLGVRNRGHDPAAGSGTAPHAADSSVAGETTPHKTVGRQTRPRRPVLCVVAAAAPHGLAASRAYFSRRPDLLRAVNSRDLVREQGVVAVLAGGVVIGAAAAGVLQHYRRARCVAK